jgi:hypothetical protein
LHPKSAIKVHTVLYVDKSDSKLTITQTAITQGFSVDLFLLWKNKNQNGIIDLFKGLALRSWRQEMNVQLLY